MEGTKQAWISEGMEVGYYTPLVRQTLSWVEPLKSRHRVKYILQFCYFSNLANILVLNLVSVS